MILKDLPPPYYNFVEFGYFSFDDLALAFSVSVRVLRFSYMEIQVIIDVWRTIWIETQ